MVLPIVLAIGRIARLILTAGRITAQTGAKLWKRTAALRKVLGTIKDLTKFVATHGVASNRWGTYAYSIIEEAAEYQKSLNSDPRFSVIRLETLTCGGKTLRVAQTSTCGNSWFEAGEIDFTPSGLPGHDAILPRQITKSDGSWAQRGWGECYIPPSRDQTYHGGLRILDTIDTPAGLLDGDLVDQEGFLKPGVFNSEGCVVNSSDMATLTEWVANNAGAITALELVVQGLTGTKLKEEMTDLLYAAHGMPDAMFIGGQPIGTMPFGVGQPHSTEGHYNLYVRFSEEEKNWKYGTKQPPMDPGLRGVGIFSDATSMSSGFDSTVPNVLDPTKIEKFGTSPQNPMVGMQTLVTFLRHKAVPAGCILNIYFLVQGGGAKGSRIMPWIANSEACATIDMPASAGEINFDTYTLVGGKRNDQRMKSQRYKAANPMEVTDYMILDMQKSHFPLILNCGNARVTFQRISLTGYGIRLGRARPGKRKLWDQFAGQSAVGVEGMSTYAAGLWVRSGHVTWGDASMAPSWNKQLMTGFFSAAGPGGGTAAAGARQIEPHPIAPASANAWIYPPTAAVLVEGVSDITIYNTFFGGDHCNIMMAWNKAVVRFGHPTSYTGATNTVGGCVIDKGCGFYTFAQMNDATSYFDYVGWYRAVNGATQPPAHAPTCIKGTLSVFSGCPTCEIALGDKLTSEGAGPTWNKMPTLPPASAGPVGPDNNISPGAFCSASYAPGSAGTLNPPIAGGDSFQMGFIRGQWDPTSANGFSKMLRNAIIRLQPVPMTFLGGTNVPGTIAEAAAVFNIASGFCHTSTAFMEQDVPEAPLAQTAEGTTVSAPGSDSERAGEVHLDEFVVLSDPPP